MPPLQKGNEDASIASALSEEVSTITFSLNLLSVPSLYSWICWSFQKNVIDSWRLSFVNQHTTRGDLSHTHFGVLILTRKSFILNFCSLSFWNQQFWNLIHIRITSKDFKNVDICHSPPSARDSDLSGPGEHLYFLKISWFLYAIRAENNWYKQMTIYLFSQQFWMK